MVLDLDAGNLMSAGTRLKELRSSLKMKQSDFASVLGVSLRAYNNYESDEAEIPTKIIRKLRDLYGVSSDWLLFGVKPRAEEELTSLVAQAGVALAGYLLGTEDRVKAVGLGNAAAMWFSLRLDEQSVTKDRLRNMLSRVGS